MSIVFSHDFDLSIFAKDTQMLALAVATEAADRIGQLITERIYFRLSQPGSGRLYKSKTGSGKHQASAPGESPAPDTGAYRESWSYRVVKSGAFASVQVGSELWTVFGRRLEFGGSGGGTYIAPRPHIRPAFYDVEHQINQISSTVR